MEIEASDGAHATLIQIGDQSEMVTLFGRLVNLGLTLVTVTLIDSYASNDDDPQKVEIGGSS